MRTTLEIPDELMRAVKVRAAQRDHSLTEEISAMLRAGLDQPDSATSHRVRLPLVRSGRNASEQETSPTRIAEILAQAELEELSD